jgi:hypothetical protein
MAAPDQEIMDGSLYDHFNRYYYGPVNENFKNSEVLLNVGT